MVDHAVGTDRSVEVTLRLMRMALPLLDRSARDLAAAKLQHAIDEAEQRGG